MYRWIVSVTQRPLGVLVNPETSTFAEVVVETELPPEEAEPHIFAALNTLGVIRSFRPHWETVCDVPQPAPAEMALPGKPDWERPEMRLWVLSPPLPGGRRGSA